MTRSRVLGAALLAVTAVVLAACAAGPNVAAAGGTDVAGFWHGLWHGVISPITFLISLFNDNVNIYEVRNNGNWYDFGFMFGVLVVLSGGAGSRAASSPGRPVKDRSRTA